MSTGFNLEHVTRSRLLTVGCDQGCKGDQSSQVDVNRFTQTYKLLDGPKQGVNLLCKPSVNFLA